MLKEFKAFAFRGNALDLAVGVILGAAFGAVVSSLVNDVVINLIAAAFGRPDFTGLLWNVGRSEIRYGSFLTAFFNFLLVAIALFLLIKALNRAFSPAGERAEMRECPHCYTLIPAKATKCSGCGSTVEPVKVKG